MANNNIGTLFQRLSKVVTNTGTGAGNSLRSNVVSYNIPASQVVYTASSPEEREQKLLQLRQQKFLSYQWRRIAQDSSMESLAGATEVRVMYRDADLMDQWPDINSALHILSEEATVTRNGKMLNIYSRSERIQSILEDLFYNRLDSNIMLPMIARNTCKYGNQFMYLNIDEKNGVIGWRQLDVHQMRRIENGVDALGSGYVPNAMLDNKDPDDVKFVWEGHNEAMPFKNWQVAHFRLIKDTMYLPYGVSYLNGARRHWRLLSMMEDAIFLHRLERSVERRVFKVNVGAIDEADVEAFMQEFANNFKRAPIVDPKTGQIDLRRNFLDVSQDIFIPVRNGVDTASIDSLPAADYDKGIEDIEYMERKILSMLRVPKTFLNFNETQGKGQNLSLMDIRFSRTINWIQQTLLMELNKIAIIHLYLLGFEDELTNFTLSMNNPSNQIETLELENLRRKIDIASAASAEQGNGLPLMPWHDIQKKIMGYTDAEISDNLNKMRIESALANELNLTPSIIERTGMFDKADRIYGKIGAKYQQMPDGEGGPGVGGGGAPGGMGGGLGDLGDFDEPGAEEGADLSGDEGEADMGDENMPPLEESKHVHVGYFGRALKNNQDPFELYNETVLNREEKKDKQSEKIINKSLLINEELSSKVGKLLEETKQPEK